MQGFHPEFRDAEDFSRKITNRIWPERGLDRIREYYAPDCTVAVPLFGVTRSVEDVVQATLRTMSDYPDYRMYDEDFIWSEDEPGVFYNSHRIVSTMTHAAHGMFGPPTGKQLTVRVIADVMYRGNQAYNEYLLKEYASVARQLGIEPREHARAMAEADHAAGRPFADAEKLALQWVGGPSPKPMSALTQHYAETLQGVFQDARIRATRDQHDDSCTTYACGETFYGYDGLDRFLIGFASSFPRGDFRLHHWTEMRVPDRPIRLSLRWTLVAGHDGFGRFGPPSGARIAVMGISNAELWGERVKREWHFVDELHVWKQIADHQVRR